MKAITIPKKIDRARVESDEAYKQRLRLECQTNMLYLAAVLGYNKIDPKVHGPAIEKCCVLKNPALDIEQQSPIKQRLHLDPRGTFKSTISIVDSVQWIIGFPNVRICTMTSTKPLGVAIVSEITDHFVLGKNDTPSDFQLLFPEFCILPVDKRVGVYTAPCRTRAWREETVMAFSIETSISGWHFDVVNLDDPVDTQNSSTKEGLAKVKKNWSVNKKTLMPWGYIGFKGTRYEPFDLWGATLEKANPAKLRVLVRAALKLKDGSRLEPGEFPAASEMDLLFPELLSYQFLKDAFEEDYQSFMTQYMNDAHGGNEVTFTPELMLAGVVEEDRVPLAGELTVVWRFACPSRPRLAHDGAAVGLMDGGRMYIVDALKGSFKPSVRAHKVVQLAKKHGSHEVSIEDTPGARNYLESAIQNYAATMGWPLTIHWLEFQEDEDVRDLRIKGTEPLIAAGRLVFSAGVGAAKELHKQFVHYGAIDDCELPDVVSRVAERLPRSIVNAESDSEQDAMFERIQQRDMHDRIHGLGRYARPVEVVEEKPIAPENEYGLDNMLGGLNG